MASIRGKKCKGDGPQEIMTSRPPTPAGGVRGQNVNPFPLLLAGRREVAMRSQGRIFRRAAFPIRAWSPLTTGILISPQHESISLFKFPIQLLRSAAQGQSARSSRGGTKGVYSSGGEASVHGAFRGERRGEGVPFKASRQRKVQYT